MERLRIAIVGSGNVATHIAHALSANAVIEQIYSRNIDNAAKLAASIPGSCPIDSLEEIEHDVDYCIVSVKDDAIANVASNLPEIKGIVAHTSGSVSMEVLSATQKRYGVFYPLQTFSRDVPLDISKVPFFIEGSNEAVADKLGKLASLLSENVYSADSQQRALLHIAAVFGCNFFNHLLHISTEVLSMGGYDLSVLEPLLYETLRKAMINGPYNSQTGPAMRGDTAIMSRHIESLPAPWAEIYKLMSNDIYSTHNLKIKSLDI